ncbi:MAG: arylsulfatase [Gemmatales bacterium]
MISTNRQKIVTVACMLFSLLVFIDVLHGQEPLPNIVFILADDLGTYELGCYGQKKIKTPNIDRLAERGMKFTRFYAGNNVCAPSRCSLLTGMHPGHATIRDNREAQPEGQEPIRADEVTLSSILKQKGYATGAIGKWGLGMFNTPGDPLKHGFDFFFGYNCQRHAHSHYPKYLYRNSQRFELQGNTYSHDLLEAESLQFIRQHREKPFFLYLPYIIPHVAVQVPEDDLNEYRGKLGDDPAYDGKKGYVPHPAPHAGYAAMVSRLDRTVGKIMALLDELHLTENTLIIFTSDNGPTHNVGGADSAFFESAGKLRGLKGSMHEGGLRVPFIASWKGKIKPGSVCDSRWAFWDVMPTLGEVAQTKVPGKVDGISFLPTLLGQPQPKQHEFFYWESGGYGGQQAVIAGPWKAVRTNLRQQVGQPKLKTQLFNIDVDESETRDVASEHLRQLAVLENIMKHAHTPSMIFPLSAIDSTVTLPGKKK